MSQYQLGKGGNTLELNQDNNWSCTLTSCWRSADLKEQDSSRPAGWRSRRGLFFGHLSAVDRITFYLTTTVLRMTSESQSLNDKVFLLVQLEFPIIQSELFCLNSHLTPFLLCPQAKSQFQVTGVWCNCSLHSPTCFVLMHLVSERWSSCFTCWQDTACSNTANIDSRIPIPIPLEAIRCWSISGPLMSKSAISPRPAEVTYLVTKDKNP